MGRDGRLRVFLGARIHAVVRDIQVLESPTARIAKIPVRRLHAATVLAFTGAANFRFLRVVLPGFMERTVSVRRRRVRTDDWFPSHVRGFGATIPMNENIRSVQVRERERESDIQKDLPTIDNADELPGWTRN